jgi:hypothetical protein
MSQLVGMAVLNLLRTRVIVLEKKVFQKRTRREAVKTKGNLHPDNTL